MDKPNGLCQKQHSLAVLDQRRIRPRRVARTPREHAVLLARGLDIRLLPLWLPVRRRNLAASHVIRPARERMEVVGDIEGVHSHAERRALLCSSNSILVPLSTL